MCKYGFVLLFFNLVYVLTFCFFFLDSLLPYKQRPQTSAFSAHRLVTGALGIKSNITPEQRAAEKKKLQEAKGN